MLITDPVQLQDYKKRSWQGIPSIECTRGGRLFATFYTGGSTEGAGNYAVLKKSDDKGNTWSDFIAVYDPGTPRRAFDPAIWLDPKGRLWWFWSESMTTKADDQFDGVGGVCYVRCDHPDAEELIWTEPVRFANGVMMNKPTVLSTGEWLFPCAVWIDSRHHTEGPEYRGFSSPQWMLHEKNSNVYLSTDEGETFSFYGQADIPGRSFDEHMVIELKDGSLMMLVRTVYGIGKSMSYDKGKTWTPGEDSGFGGPCARFFIRRLKSGRILLVNHHEFTGRNNIKALLSDDECKSFNKVLLLDARDKIAYPDGAEGPDGNLYIIYDHDRYGDKDIFLARVTEQDILEEKLVSPSSALQLLVDKV